ncbi:phage D domain protein [Candidatus Erwinia dacicola]|uniref:Phage D domain protein n=1 Tax=Candidatus Erwinia dacicola TaxID=252393 RepID=A0A328TMC8_9GAMM|nr:phage D domain protein [Candidatus Erwinia dacicola]
MTADRKALPSASIDRTSGDQHRFYIADRDAYTGIRAYWLDLNCGKIR